MKRLIVLLVGLTLVVGACADGDDNASSLLDTVQARGTVLCGVNDVLPGFGIVDDAGNFGGFDVDLCRVVAAAVLGNANAVEFVPLTAGERFTALQSGEIDVLIRNTTWTATRDGQEGSTFLLTTFYDGQGVMVPEASDVTSIEDLADANICVLSGTTTELNLTSVFNSRGIPFNPVVYADNTGLRPAYEEGQCDAWTSDVSQLTAYKAAIEDEGGAAQRILSDVISKEPLGPVVLDGDSGWAQAVEWAIMATVQAWEFGITSGNVTGFPTDDDNVRRFLGQLDFEAGLGLPSDFAVQVISQVGNYEEIYNRHLVPIGLPLSGSPNDLWTNGGLMYVPPYR